MTWYEIREMASIRDEKKLIYAMESECNVV